MDMALVKQPAMIKASLFMKTEEAGFGGQPMTESTFVATDDRQNSDRGTNNGDNHGSHKYY